MLNLQLEKECKKIDSDETNNIMVLFNRIHKFPPVKLNNYFVAILTLIVLDTYCEFAINLKEIKTLLESLMASLLIFMMLLKTNSFRECPRSFYLI
jgi:hypothetical protein